MNNWYIYFIQIVFASGIAIGSPSLSEGGKHKWLNVARYAFYILTITAVPEGLKIRQGLQARLHDKAAVYAKAETVITYILIYVACAGSLVYYGESLFNEDFVYVFFAYLIVKYLEMASPPSPPESVAERQPPTISYGVGMACSYFEGYLTHVLPSDGAQFVGFKENMRALEDREGVLFPVKKLFIIVAKNLFSPPDLNAFNKDTDRTDIAYLEAFNVLPEIKKSVAGTRDRRYHNTVYKIYRPGGPPVCVAAECATPLHTLYRVLNNRTLYAELADIDVARVVEDFCATLRNVLRHSAPCRAHCELLHFDPDDPTQNLADILLARIRELEPNFEQKIIARREQNVILDD